MNLEFDGIYSDIPFITQHSLRAYIEHGQPVGGFLEAVLTNDLFKSYHLADDENAVALHLIVKWLYDRAPGGCLGSRENHKTWMAHRGLKGLTYAA